MAIIGVSTLLFSAQLIVSTSFAQEEGQEPPAYEHLKQLEPFVGKWQGKFDPPGNAPLGTITVTTAWVGNKSYLYSEVLYTPDGMDAVLNQGNTMIGYNWKTKSVHAWEFGWVTQTSMPVVVTENKMMMEGGEVFSRNENRTPKTTTVELTDPNTIVTTSHHLKNGQRVAYEHLTLKRIE
ncbi:hypothetical protein [Planctomycetes bacterium CA13]|uniref:hypothetical protein n=1 Tax=Novipirellula herctigrandis TaxID=2527986 RepID=UPI0011B7A97B